MILVFNPSFININVINIEENVNSNDLVEQLPLENLNYNTDLLNFKSLFLLFANRIAIVILQQLVSDSFCKNNPKLTLICTMFDQYFPITSTCFIVPMSHVKCATLLDENVHAEMQQFWFCCSLFLR